MQVADDRDQLVPTGLSADSASSAADNDSRSSDPNPSSRNSAPSRPPAREYSSTSDSAKAGDARNVWPVSPDDIIELDLSSQWGPESQLHMRWLRRTPPDERGIGITRQRLNRKFGGDIHGLVDLFSWGTRW